MSESPSPGRRGRASRRRRGAPDGTDGVPSPLPAPWTADLLASARPVPHILPEDGFRPQERERVPPLPLPSEGAPVRLRPPGTRPSVWLSHHPRPGKRTVNPDLEPGILLLLQADLGLGQVAETRRCIARHDTMCHGSATVGGRRVHFAAATRNGLSLYALGDTPLGLALAAEDDPGPDGPLAPDRLRDRVRRAAHACATGRCAGGPAGPAPACEQMDLALPPGFTAVAVWCLPDPPQGP